MPRYKEAYEEIKATITRLEEDLAKEVAREHEERSEATKAGKAGKTRPDSEKVENLREQIAKLEGELSDARKAEADPTRLLALVEARDGVEPIQKLTGQVSGKYRQVIEAGLYPVWRDSLESILGTAVPMTLGHEPGGRHREKEEKEQKQPKRRTVDDARPPAKKASRAKRREIKKARVFFDAVKKTSKRGTYTDTDIEAVSLHFDGPNNLVRYTNNSTRDALHFAKFGAVVDGEAVFTGADVYKVAETFAQFSRNFDATKFEVSDGECRIHSANHSIRVPDVLPGGKYKRGHQPLAIVPASPSQEQPETLSMAFHQLRVFEKSGEKRYGVTFDECYLDDGNAVWTDSVRLVVYKYCEKGPDGWRMKMNTLRILAPLIRAKGATLSAAMGKDDAMSLHIAMDGLLWSVTLDDAKTFPNYRQILPKSQGYSITFSMLKWKPIIDAAKNIAKENKHKIHLDVSMASQGRVRCYAYAGAQGKVAFDEELPVQSASGGTVKAPELAFNALFILNFFEAVKNEGGDVCKFEAKNDKYPTDWLHGPIRYILMPINI